MSAAITTEIVGAASFPTDLYWGGKKSATAITKVPTEAPARAGVGVVGRLSPDLGGIGASLSVSDKIV